MFWLNMYKTKAVPNPKIIKLEIDSIFTLEAPFTILIWLMRKLLIVLLLVFASKSAKCDMIPYWLHHYALIGYSFEGIICYEKVVYPRTTWNCWVGGGIVGSAIYLNEPAFGIEGAIERRLYFKRDKFSGLNLCWYLGTSLMYNNQEKLNLAFLPGLKLTHKSLINGKVLVEP